MTKRPHDKNCLCLACDDARDALTAPAPLPARFRVTIGNHSAEITVDQHAPVAYHQGMIQGFIENILWREVPVCNKLAQIHSICIQANSRKELNLADSILKIIEGQAPPHPKGTP